MTYQLKPESPERLLREWEHLNRIVLATQAYLNECSQCLASVEKSLDAATRPSAPGVTPGFRPMGYSYKGNFYRHKTKKEMYLDILTQLFRDFHEQSDQIVTAISRRGRIRSYLSRNRYDLFPGKSVAWIEKHSTLLGDWWADTNLGQSAMRRVLAAATKVTGLQLGKDLLITWNTQRTMRAYPGTPH